MKLVIGYYAWKNYCLIIWAENRDGFTGITPLLNVSESPLHLTNAYNRLNIIQSCRRLNIIQSCRRLKQIFLDPPKLSHVECKTKMANLGDRTSTRLVKTSWKVSQKLQTFAPFWYHYLEIHFRRINYCNKRPFLTFSTALSILGISENFIILFAFKFR